MDCPRINRQSIVSVSRLQEFSLPFLLTVMSSPGLTGWAADRTRIGS